MSKPVFDERGAELDEPIKKRARALRDALLAQYPTAAATVEGIGIMDGGLVIVYASDEPISIDILRQHLAEEHGFTDLIFSKPSFDLSPQIRSALGNQGLL